MRYNAVLLCVRFSEEEDSGFVNFPVKLCAHCQLVFLQETKSCKSPHMELIYRLNPVFPYGNTSDETNVT